MKDLQILSTLRRRASDRIWPDDGPQLLFDTCRVGEVLRAVLLVQAVMTVASLYWQLPFAQWLLRYSILTGATLPATLAWLITACALKKLLARIPPVGQYACGVGLGALAGLYGCAMLAFAELVSPAPWVASALTGALLAGALVAGLVLRAKGRLPAATLARLSELQARIRPHFLFNTLNSAIALVRAEPRQAEGLLEDLSDLFRQALANPGEAVTLEEEITLAQRYLAIEQVRFGERLQVHWSLDPEAKAAKVPHLLLQPLVENAVVHGVEPSEQGSRIDVSTQRKGDKVVLQVVNTLPPDGPTTSAPRGSGMALANVRDRLNLLHDLQGEFSAGPKQGRYVVRIEVPL